MKKLPVNLTLIGRLGKVRGVNGQLKLHVEEAYEDLVNQLAYVFVLHNGSPVPYAVDSIIDAHALFIQLEDVKNGEHAKELAGNDIYINKNEFPEIQWDALQTKNNEISQFIGFSVFDIESEIRGEILTIEMNEFQTLMIVDVGTHQSYVPFIEEFIGEIDMEKKEITLHLPEGILTNSI